MGRAGEKRSHKTLSLKQRSEVLRELENGKSLTKTAEKFGVGVSTVFDIKQKKEKILNFISNMDVGPGKRKTLRSGEFPELEKHLYTWFLQQRNRHATISTEILMMKAKTMHEKYYPNKVFNASRGWIIKFKKRYGIRSLKVCGEKLSNDEQAILPFQDKLKRKVKEMGLDIRQIYNADESALFWRMLPPKTLVHAKESTAPGRKISKDRVTFLCCSNVTGSHKLELLIIGKSKSPRALKNIKLPAIYKATSNAWMTSSLFADWFHNIFVKDVRNFLKNENLPPKALLLIDNAPSHPSDLISDDKNIEVMFLPPKTTALIQPMDQNVINVMKINYKKSLLTHIISQEESDISICLKQFSLKDAICYATQSWNKVKDSTIRKCWNKLFPEDIWDSDDEISLSELRHRLRSTANTNAINSDVSELSSLIQRVSHQPVTNEEVREWIEEDCISICSSDNEETEVQRDTNQQPKMKHEDAVAHFNGCLKWSEENDVPLHEQLLLRRLREKAVLASLERIKQTSIDNYFKRK